MSPLSLLSKYQLIAFLAVWCDLKDVTLLDTAVCMKDERQFILNTFSNETPFLQYYPCHNDGLLIAWLGVRKIKFDSIAVFEAGASLSSWIVCDHLLRLSISDCSKNISSHKIAQFINRCIKLTELCIVNVEEFSPETCKQINDKIWNQLSATKFHSKNKCIKELLRTLAKACNNPNSFDFMMTYGSYFVSDIDILFKNNQKLQKLTMNLCRVSDDFFKAVLEHAPLLREIELNRVEVLSIAALAMFLTNSTEVVFEQISITTVKKLEFDDDFVDSDFHYNRVNGTLNLLYYAHDWSLLLANLKGIKNIKLKVLTGYHDYCYTNFGVVWLTNDTLYRFIDNNCDTLESLCIGDEKHVDSCRSAITQYALRVCTELKHLIMPQLRHEYDRMLPWMLKAVPNNKIEHLEIHSIDKDPEYLRKTFLLLPHLKQFTYGCDFNDTIKNNLDNLTASFPHVSFVGK